MQVNRCAFQRKPGALEKTHIQFCCQKEIMLCVPFGEKLLNVFFLNQGEAPKGKFIYGCTNEACKPSVEDPEEGPREPCPTLFLDQTEAQRAVKIIFKTAPPPLSEGLDLPLTLTLFKTKSVHYPVEDKRPFSLPRFISFWPQ